MLHGQHHGRQPTWPVVAPLRRACTAHTAVSLSMPFVPPSTMKVEPASVTLPLACGEHESLAGRPCKTQSINFGFLRRRTRHINQQQRFHRLQPTEGKKSQLIFLCKLKSSTKTKGRRGHTPLGTGSTYLPLFFSAGTTHTDY